MGKLIEKVKQSFATFGDNRKLIKDAKRQHIKSYEIEELKEQQAWFILKCIGVALGLVACVFLAVGLVTVFASIIGGVVLGFFFMRTVRKIFNQK